ncbi:MAG: hypothetical protein H8E44_33560 [Planctomycetes bacterium]|nr:hypothetical protein [Planctomycetota bacterium]
MNRVNLEDHSRRNVLMSYKAAGRVHVTSTGVVPNEVGGRRFSGDGAREGI